MRNGRNGVTRSSAAIAALLMTALIFVDARSASAGGDWNDAQIQWQPYEQGLAAAKKDNKPVLLVFFTTWCPHCTNYSKIFHDPKVVEQSKNFVMIRVDKDEHPDISKKYVPDGEYIPRTYFLRSDGTLEAGLNVGRDQYKYFYDERSPDMLLTGIDKALKKLR